MKDIIRICNPAIRFSNFTLNIKIYVKFEGFLSKLVWRETLFKEDKLLSSFEFQLVCYRYNIPTIFEPIPWLVWSSVVTF